MRRAPSRSRWLERRARAAASAIVVAALLLIDVRSAGAEPASALVMPFDASTSTVSFLVVSHPAGDPAGGVRTHWAFWDETCEPLADVILCLPPDGSTIVDPRHVPASGGVTDLGGQRGFVTVTAYEPGTACDPSDQGRGTLSHGALIGSFTLADIASGVSFGGAAQALGADPSGTFVDLGATSDAATNVRQTSLRLQSFDPADLDVSRVILIALEEKAGAGAFRAIEPGPVSAGTDDVQTSVRFAGRDGASITLPEARLGCATFTSLRRADTPTLLPVGGPGDAVSSGGFLALENPRIGDRPLGRSTSLIGFHGQGVGTFGVLTVGDTTLGSSSAPTPAPTGAATATPRASTTATSRPSSTPTARPTITPTPRATGAVSPTPAGSATPRPTGSIVAPTTTPVATPTVVVIATPSPAASTSPHAPTPSPAPTVTKTPGTTPTAGPSASPAPSATPRPTATAAPSTTPSPKPTSLPPTATAAACSTLTIQVRTTYGAGAPGNVSGVVATVTYPTSVAIPGTGSDSSVTGRVSNVSGVSGLFQATDMETQVRAGLISVATAIPAGPFVRVQFDCVGGAAPSASAFGCTLEASTLEGDLLPAAACSTEVVS